MKKRKLFAVSLIMLSAIAAAGCSKKEPVKEPETVTQTEPTKEPTKTPEPETEPETEKELSLKDVQVMIRKGPKTGEAAFQIKTDSGENVVNGTFESNNEAFSITTADGARAYSGTQVTAYDIGEGWQELEDSGFTDVWSYAYETDMDMKEGMIGDVKHYVLTSYIDEPAGILEAALSTAGYMNAITGTIEADFYVNSETGALTRCDFITKFRAETADGAEAVGSIDLAARPKEADNIVIEVPSPEKQQVNDGYEAGTVSTATNVYKNITFDLQIAGKDLLTFDQEKANGLAASYMDNGGYTEEAYAEGMGGILNIVSIRNDGVSKDEIFEKYLTDSAASEIQTAGTIQVGAKTYVCIRAMINNTNTKNWCTESDGRVLIMTLYCSNDNSASSLESQMFAYADDPFWTSESWTLVGKYDVSTPKGWNLSRAESSTLYACFKKGEDRIDVFAYEYGDAASVAEGEKNSTNTKTRNVSIEDTVALADGNNMNYLIIKNTEPEYEYYVYVGIYVKGNAAFKIYRASSAGDADFREVFKEIADSTTAPPVVEAQPESET